VRILITGGPGQLGRDLHSELGDGDVRAPGREELDITDAEACLDAIRDFRPAVVVNTAALTDTWRCEREPEYARSVNAIGAQNVARACARADAALLHVSTNEVFDGERRTPYPEDAEPRPLNAYGRSKLAGEQLVSEELNRLYIVRTSWLYGAGVRNFVGKVLEASRQGEVIGVTDEVSTPTWTHDLAEAMVALLQADTPGVYHLTNAGEASRYDWAQDIVRLSGVLAPVRGITTAEYRASMPEASSVPHKPPYSVLQNSRGAAVGIELRHWKEALEDHINGPK
jgi:dTDP-4-dehydrorhamnose reductase